MTFSQLQEKIKKEVENTTPKWTKSEVREFLRAAYKNLLKEIGLLGGPR